MELSGLNKRPALTAYHFFWNAVDWVFPPRCGGCGQVGERWCSQCQGQVTRLTEACCHVCGNPLPQPGLCKNCQTTPPTFTALRSWCKYEDPARKAIHQLKYQRDIGLADALAVSLVSMIDDLQWKPGVVVSVPISPARLRQRGYNQASLLALPVALAIGAPFRPSFLVRARETASQVGLSAADRRQNVSGAFRAGPVRSLNVLVVDDVITTGSTMNACAQALLAAGASAVYGISFARAVLPDHLVPSDPIS